MYACLLRASAVLTPLCPPFPRASVRPSQMAAASAIAWVFGFKPRTFLVQVPHNSIVQDVKRCIWPGPFSSADWAVYLADAAGNKLEGTAVLDERAAFPAAPGATVNIWVERVDAPAPAAGEHRGPGSWAGGGLRARLG
jgi:hypothetical protein